MVVLGRYPEEMGVFFLFVHAWREVELMFGMGMRAAVYKFLLIYIYTYVHVHDHDNRIRRPSASHTDAHAPSSARYPFSGGINAMPPARLLCTCCLTISNISLRRHLSGTGLYAGLNAPTASAHSPSGLT